MFFDGKGLYTYGKFARELSKFWGYFFCFKYGKIMIRHRETALKMDVWFAGAACLFLTIQVAAVGIMDVGDNTALLRMVCGVLASKVFVSMFYHWHRQAGRFEKFAGGHSLEIYLIHLNIVHQIIWIHIGPAIYLPYRGLPEDITLMVLLFVLDLAVSFGIVCMEKYVPPIDFVFHPGRMLAKTKFYRKLLEDGDK